jgi:hypothetical protein
VRLSATIFALASLSAAGAQGAEPIRVLNAQPQPLPSASACAATAGGQGSDIECTLNLPAPRAGAEGVAPARILIRTQWTPRCAARDAQVVSMGAPAPGPTGLPVVEHAAPRAGCAS